MSFYLSSSDYDNWDVTIQFSFDLQNQMNFSTVSELIQIDVVSDGETLTVQLSGNVVGTKHFTIESRRFSY